MMLSLIQAIKIFHYKLIYSRFLQMVGNRLFEYNFYEGSMKQYKKKRVFKKTDWTQGSINLLRKQQIFNNIVIRKQKLVNKFVKKARLDCRTLLISNCQNLKSSNSSKEHSESIYKQRRYRRPFFKKLSLTELKKPVSEDSTSKQSTSEYNSVKKSRKQRISYNIKIKTQSKYRYKHNKKSLIISHNHQHINSYAYIVCDSNLNPLAIKNGHVPIAIASLTKLINLMVCLQILEQNGLHIDDIVEVPYFYIKRGESSAKIKEGQKISIRNLLWAMILPSGNDAAQTIALVLGKYLVRNSKKLDNDKLKQAYLQRMRQYAKRINMNKTRLLDVRGFALSFSNVSEIVLLLKQVYLNPVAAQFLHKGVINSEVMDVSDRIRHYTWTSTNLLFSEGFYGKTGHSIDGTFSFASVKSYKDQLYYICVLGSPSQTGRFSDTKYLFNHVIKKCAHQ